MSAIVLFRYSRELPICLQALRLVRALNPGLPIHGLYGGDVLEELPAELTDLLESNWRMPTDDFFYKWKNGDLCARAWFQAHGRHLSFDHVYLLEWDMLFLKPLHQVYGPLEPGANYATLFGDHAYAQEIEWHWITYHYRWETRQLLDHLAEDGLPVVLEDLSFAIMGGTVFCRPFLERFASMAVPSYSNDELRLSVYSAAFGIPLYDNRIHPRGGEDGNIYYANNEDVLTPAHVETVMARGGAVLHPVRFLLGDLEQKICTLVG